MSAIVSYDPYAKEFSFHRDEHWVETLWATIYAQNLSETAKVVFATIISHVYKEPLQFPSQRVLAEAVKKTPRTVKRAIKELKVIKLIEVPAGFSQRQNKYIIYDHSNSDLKFSPEAEGMLKGLLDISVSVFSVIGDKNVPIPKEKENEEEKEEKKVIQRKEEREEEKEKEICGEAAHENISTSHFTKKEAMLAKIDSDSSLSKKSPYGFMQQDEDRSLTEAMAEPKPQPRLPKDVHRWKTTHFEKYFADRYKKLAGNAMPVQFAKDRTVIKRMMERIADIEEIKDVIDYVFDNWEVVSQKKDLTDGYPTINLVFSRWFGTFQSMMHKGKPRSNKFADNRADYEFELPKPKE